MSIEEYTEHLFGCNFKDDTFDPDNQEEHLEMALKLLDNYSWENVYPVLINHLYTKCNTPDDVINFANLYFYYGFADQTVPNPIEFISYLYYMVDMSIDKNWDEAGDLFDSLTINVFSSCGLVNMKDNPYYSPLDDERILEGISTWKNKKAK